MLAAAAAGEVDQEDSSYTLLPWASLVYFYNKRQQKDILPILCGRAGQIEVKFLYLAVIWSGFRSPSKIIMRTVINE